MHEASFRTARTTFNDDNEYTSAYSELFNREVGEYENDGTHRRWSKPKLLRPLEAKPNVDDVVPNHTEIESIIATQVTCVTEGMIYREVSGLATDSLDDILQCAY